MDSTEVRMGFSASSPAALDGIVAAVGGKAREFAHVSPAEKARVLRECIPLVAAVAEEWVRVACASKGIALGSPAEAEEWLAGPVVTIRNVRLLAESLEHVAAGRPPAPRILPRTRADGRVVTDVFPTSALDKAMFSGFRCEVVHEAGITEADALAARAARYRSGEPWEGDLTLILGAGNVSSIPAMDALAVLFIDGCVALLKTNPVNAWVKPVLERAFAPLISRGWLRIIDGDGSVGAQLCAHPGVGRIHITGSDRTFDAIVWGPPGPEQDRRKRENDPVCRKPVTSELGNVSPVVIVPWTYSASELRFQARNVATMVANNASFNCNAAKMLITSAGWAQRKEFLDLVIQALADIPTRKAYYPGAHDRYASLLQGRDGGIARVVGISDDHLPWTLVRGLDAADVGEPLFRIEPFCAIIGETALPADEPDSFLAQAVAFCNDRLWGTLNACLIVHPAFERGSGRASVDAAIDLLRYGTVTVNHWPALGYGLVSPPWGGHPSSTPQDIQSGTGWVHNAFMLGRIEKSVLRGPLVVQPTPPWFAGNPRGPAIARRLLAMEADPKWGTFLGIVKTSLFG